MNFPRIFSLFEKIAKNSIKILKIRLKLDKKNYKNLIIIKILIKIIIFSIFLTYFSISTYNK